MSCHTGVVSFVYRRPFLSAIFFIPGLVLWAGEGLSTNKGHYDRHFEVCHVAKGGNQTIVLTQKKDLYRHLKHGDKSGRCSNKCKWVSHCNDHNACTFDTCERSKNSKKGVCKHKPVDCNDDEICTLDSCHPVEGCIHTPQSGKKCDDGKPCTHKDVCVNGECVGKSKSNFCKYHSDCVSNDKCEVGKCKNYKCVFKKLTCRGSDPCKQYTCNAATGHCDRADSLCDKTDDDPCTSDICLDAEGCVNVDNLGLCDD